MTGTRLVVIGARDQRRAAEFADVHGFERAVGSYPEVLADPEVEVVYNPLPNALHGPWNLAAIRAGTVDRRLLCGEGSFDLPGIIDALRTAGWRGPWGVEILSKQHRQTPVHQAVAAADQTARAQLDHRPAR